MPLASVTAPLAAIEKEGHRYRVAMNKYERIEAVRNLGLNTEVNVLVCTHEDWEANRQFLTRFPRYSLRTFRHTEDPSPQPHFPIIQAGELRQRYGELLGEGLNLIVAEPIDPSDAELAGCLLIEGDRLLAEVALGPGTVRRVTHDSQIDVRALWEPLTESAGDRRLDTAGQEVTRALGRVSRRPYIEFQGLLFEFSWYRINVGSKSEPLIFWEVAGTEEQERRLQELLGEV